MSLRKLSVKLFECVDSEIDKLTNGRKVTFYFWVRYFDEYNGAEPIGINSFQLG